MIRWSQEPNLGTRLHPDAIKTARALEGRGYTQHDREDLDDHEGIVAVSAADGAHAPARYYRRHKPNGENGIRPEHVVEAFPDSPWAEPLSLDDPSAKTEYEPGKWMSKVGLFRLNHPTHLDDVAELYNGRARRHRDEARGMVIPS